IQSAFILIQTDLYDPLTVTWEIGLQGITVVLRRSEDRLCKAEQTVEVIPIRILPIFGLWKINRFLAQIPGSHGSRRRSFVAWLKSAGRKGAGQLGEVKAKCGPFGQPDIKELDGEVATNPSITKPVELQMTILGICFKPRYLVITKIIVSLGTEGIERHRTQ